MNRHAVPNAILGLPGRPPNGGSHPRFYDFDDGVTRLVKWHPSGHGPKACYNELIASRLGQLLGAPILRGIVVYVSDDIIPADHRAEGAVAGFHFAMTMMKGHNFVPTQHYNEIENAAELPLAAVHLAWLSVGDQDGHNQYLQRLVIEREGAPVRETKRFKLIDMGAMFGGWSWTAGTVATVHDRYALPGHLGAQLTWTKLTAAVAELKALKDADIIDCFDDCPDGWAVPADDRAAGAARAIAARDAIEEIIRLGNPGITP